MVERGGNYRRQYERYWCLDRRHECHHWHSVPGVIRQHHRHHEHLRSAQGAVTHSIAYIDSLQLGLEFRLWPMMGCTTHDRRSKQTAPHKGVRRSYHKSDDIFAHEQTMMKCVHLLPVFVCAVTLLFAAAFSATAQSTAPEGVMLPTVNGAPFTSGPVTVDNAHCGWNYVLGGGTFYVSQVPNASGFPVGCRITITNADPLPTGSNATGAKWIIVG